MREIKFRAWSEVLKCWSYRDCELVGWGDTFSIGSMHEVVQQYTGLKDKNGKEIYEGDALWGDEYGDDEEHPEGFRVVSGIVAFKDGRFRLEYPDGSVSDDDNAEHPDWWDQYEVIGNIYENPELLEGSK